jgi:hypothetical protein
VALVVVFFLHTGLGVVGRSDRLNAVFGDWQKGGDWMGPFVVFLLFVAGGIVVSVARLSSSWLVRVVCGVCGVVILFDGVLSLLHVI